MSVILCNMFDTDTFNIPTIMDRLTVTLTLSSVRCQSDTGQKEISWISFVRIPQEMLFFPG